MRSITNWSELQQNWLIDVRHNTIRHAANCAVRATAAAERAAREREHRTVSLMVSLTRVFVVVVVALWIVLVVVAAPSPTGRGREGERKKERKGEHKWRCLLQPFCRVVRGVMCVVFTYNVAMMREGAREWENGIEFACCDFSQMFDRPILCIIMVSGAGKNRNSNTKPVWVLHYLSSTLAEILSDKIR